MNALYRVIGISRQGFHHWLDRQMLRKEEQHQLLRIVYQLRNDHPRLSCRQMYYMLTPKTMGRDEFESFCFSNGYKVKVYKRYTRTTNCTGGHRFDNLLLETEQITSIDQVWVSDITYFQLQSDVWYLSFIIDLYSRYIVGYSVSKSLRTEETTLPALIMATTFRDRKDFGGMIFHSDGGGQYYSKTFTSYTQKFNIRNSMCDIVYNNANAERVNGTIKNDYLIPYQPQDSEQLKHMTKKAVYLYNNQRPHQSLARLTPLAFEKASREGIIKKSWRVNKKMNEKAKTQVNISIIS